MWCMHAVLYLKRMAFVSGACSIVSEATGDCELDGLFCPEKNHGEVMYCKLIVKS